jgi:hypothetical protein
MAFGGQVERTDITVNPAETQEPYSETHHVPQSVWRKAASAAEALTEHHVADTTPLNTGAT